MIDILDVYQAFSLHVPHFHRIRSVEIQTSMTLFYISHHLTSYLIIFKSYSTWYDLVIIDEDVFIYL